MSKLYLSGTSDSRKTEITSRGHRHVRAHLRNWDCGVEISAAVNEDGSTTFYVYRTGGSNNPSNRRLVVFWDDPSDQVLIDPSVEVINERVLDEMVARLAKKED